MKKNFFILFVILFFCLSLNVIFSSDITKRFTQTNFENYSTDFEDCTVGASPNGWLGDSTYRLAVSAQEAFSGTKSLRVHGGSSPNPNIYIPNTVSDKNVIISFKFKVTQIQQPYHRDLILGYFFYAGEVFMIRSNLQSGMIYLSHGNSQISSVIDISGLKPINVWYEFKLEIDAVNKTGVVTFADETTTISLALDNLNGGIYSDFTVGDDWPQGTIYFDDLSIVDNSSSTIFSLDGNGTVFNSTDNGISWNIVNQNNEISGAKKIVSDNSGSLFILTDNSEIYKSSDEGVNWELVNSDYNGSEASSSWLTMSYSKTNNYLFIIEKSGDDVWRSPDNGVTWEKVNDNYNGSVNPRPKGSAVDSDGNLFVVDRNADIWKSGDNGVTFSKINDDYNGNRNNYAGDYVIDNQTHYIVMDVGGASYVYKSTDSGLSFVDMGKVTQSGEVGAMTFSNGNIFSAVNYGNKAPDIHGSDNGASSWSFLNEITTTVNIISMTRNY